MNRIIFSIALLLMQGVLLAQTGKVVLIEEFVETGCSACAQYDSAFQAITTANGGKVAVINYHCFYILDPFYQYNKVCDSRYSYYGLSGYPCAMMNGAEPAPASAHLSYVTPARINTLYNQPALFKIEITSKPARDSARSANIEVTATALADNPSDSLRLFVAATENNIDYKKRFGSASVNGVNEFNHILRAMLPGAGGTLLGAQLKGQANKVSVTFTNDDKLVNYEEVRIVVFIQDMITKEVLAAAVMLKHPF